MLVRVLEGEDQVPPPQGQEPLAACASCKYDKRGCHIYCTFRPYFPPGNILDFENVHRTFTRHNVGTWIRARQNEQERVDLVTAVRWEAARRRDDPILGSYGIHLEHLAQIEDLEAANAALVAQLNNNGNNNGNFFHLYKI
jgi:hypothetical protein